MRYFKDSIVWSIIIIATIVGFVTWGRNDEIFFKPTDTTPMLNGKPVNMSAKDYRLLEPIGGIIDTQYKYPEIVFQYKTVDSKRFFLQNDGKSSTRLDITNKLTSKQKDYIQAYLRQSSHENIEIKKDGSSYMLGTLYDLRIKKHYDNMAFFLFASIIVFGALVFSFILIFTTEYRDYRWSHQHGTPDHDDMDEQKNNKPTPWTV